MRIKPWLAALAAALLAGCATRPQPALDRLVLSHPGPFPIRSEFTATRERQLLVVAGSAWNADGDAVLIVEVVVDGSIVARGRLFSNAGQTHRALVFPAVPLALSAGRHTLEVRAGNDATVSDPEDHYEVTLVER